LANFANLTAQLNLNIQNFARNIQKASALASKFASDLQGKINIGMVEPAKKSKFAFKDVSRIVHGIIVSKIFYSSLNTIRRATDAVWEFSKELEYAQMVYSNLFGDTELAQEFINVLKDFAAVTPFSFKQAEEAAKRLLAYGIEAKNVMFLMQGVLSAATVQGTDAVIGPISRAFGQIYTKGRLMNEEMRQLAEAGIPAYEILQEKLNLTAEELRNLGRTAIPAHVALNALVEGINERFGTTLKLASTTTQGIISNIVDNSKMLFAGIFEPFIKYLRGVLGRFGEFINELRRIYDLKGLGGVFEKLIPPALQQDIKVFIANLKILWDIIKSNLVSVFKTLGSLLKGLLRVFNALAPAIYTVIGTLAGLLKIITSNEKLMKGLTTAILAAAAAWAVYKLQAVAASITTVVIKGIVGAIKGLVAAMNFVVAHPIWALLALGVSIFIALTGASDKFRDSINKLFSGFTKLSGMDPNKMLLPDSKDRASDLDKFNKALDGTGKGMDELSKKANKASKSLLSFDEVFSLERPDKGNATDQWEDFMGIFDGAGLDLSDMQIEFPDVGGIATDFVDNLIGALGGKDKLLGAGIGGLLGAALGNIIGGPIGTKIGGILGAIAGWFWDDLANALGLTDVGKVAVPIATGLGAAIGALIGGPFGAVIGAGIGALVGWIIDSITRGFETGDWSKVGYPIGIGIGAAIGFIVGGPGGALIGGGIGLLVGWFVDEIAKALETGDWSTVAAAGGIGIGAAIGAIAGGPAGALVGGGIGLLVGWFVNEIAKALKTGNWSTVALAGGTGIGAAIGMIAGGPAGALVGGGIGLLVGWFVDEIAKALETGDWSTVALAGGAGIGAAIGMIAGGPGGALIGGGIGLLVGWLVDEIAKALETGDWSTIGLSVGTGLGAAIGLVAGGPLGAVVGTAIGALVGWITDMFIEGFSTGNWDVSGISLGLGTGIGAAIGMIAGGPVGALIGGAIGALIGWLIGLISDNWGAITDWFEQAWADIGEFFAGIGEWFAQVGKEIGDFFAGIGEWLDQAWTDITTWLTDLLKTIGEFFVKIWDTIKEKLSGAWDSVKEFFQKMWDTIKEKLSGAWDSVKEFFQNIWDTIKEKLSGAWDSVKEFFQKMWNTIREKLSGAWNSVKEFFQKMWDTIREKLSGAWNSVKEFFQKMWDTIKEKLSGAWNSVKEFFQKMWDTISTKITDMYESVKSGISNIYQAFKDWISDMWNNVFGKFFDWINSAIDKLKTFFGLNSKAQNTDISYATTGESTGTVTKGHKVGGIFNREHIARFAEGNKAEAIIPLENESAMKPFVDAVSNGLTSALMPLIANISVGQQSQLQPLYVGTLIADERGLKELSRKMEVIQLEEKARRG